METSELGQAVGLKIKTLRTSRGLKRSPVAKSLGHKYQWLWDIERGRRLPTLPDIYALAELFGVSADELLKEETTNASPL